jgi:hypothetical protein
MREGDSGVVSKQNKKHLRRASIGSEQHAATWKAGNTTRTRCPHNAATQHCHVTSSTSFS